MELVKNLKNQSINEIFFNYFGHFNFTRYFSKIKNSFLPSSDDNANICCIVNWSFIWLEDLVTLLLSLYLFEGHYWIASIFRNS